MQKSSCCCLCCAFVSSSNKRCVKLNCWYWLTVKYFLFARTLFLHKFARAKRRENKVLANNSLCEDYKRRCDKSRKYIWWINHGWCLHKNKVTKITSVLQYLFCLLHVNHILEMYAMSHDAPYISEIVNYCLAPMPWTNMVLVHVHVTRVS